MSGTPIGHTEKAPRLAILFGSQSWPGAVLLVALVVACWPLAAQVPPPAVDVVVLDRTGVAWFAEVARRPRSTCSANWSDTRMA